MNALIEALAILRPGANYLLRGDTLDGLDWQDTSPRPTAEEIAAVQGQVAVRVFTELKAAELAKFRADRREMFALIGDMGFVALQANDTDTAAALATFRVGVMDLPDFPTVTQATTHATLKAAMAARYKALTGALPAHIKTMFAKLAA